jgi:hypothetical protein
MTGKEVSVEQVKVMRVLKNSRTWRTSKTIAGDSQVPESTVRHLLLQFFKMRILERMELFGGYRYRMASTLPCGGYYKQIVDAMEIL